MASKKNIPIVVVTGASGYVGTELAKQLLDQGYTVRATSREPNKNEFLTAMGDALAGKLEMWAVDMTDEDGFDAVVKGATYVFHCAAIVDLGSGDHEKDKREIVEPVIDGAENVIRSIIKAKTVQKLIVTSSVAAIRNPADDRPGKTYSHEDWSDSSNLDMPYFVAKREAEKNARRLVEEHNINLVTIHPSLIIGPVVSRKGGVSVGTVQGVLEGKPPLEALLDNCYVDVRDVARAHIAAAELPKATGRYILSHERSVNRKHVVELLRENFPDYPIQDCADEETKQIYDTSKSSHTEALWQLRRAYAQVSELGLGELIHWQKSFVDQARCTIALGLVS